MKVNLINIGRNNINRSFELKELNWTKIAKEVSKHLASKGIDIEEDPNTHNGYNVIAGFRTVGKITIEE